MGHIIRLIECPTKRVFFYCYRDDGTGIQGIPMKGLDTLKEAKRAWKNQLKLDDLNRNTKSETE